ncbi:hypothetical protein ACFLZN_02110 [Nanoarchaeota archaeon]
MSNITLAIPDDLHKKMKKHSEIRWSEVVRKSIAEKIKVLEMLDKITQKSKMTAKDVKELAKKINKEVFLELNKQ